jgi:hypothetical protein
MPHVERVEVDGEVISSVNGFTGCLSKEGIDRWKQRYLDAAVEVLLKAENKRTKKAWKRLRSSRLAIKSAIENIQFCDKVRDESADNGTEITKLFEDIAKGLEVEVPEKYQRFVNSFLNWQAKHNYRFVAVEPHLINPIEMYHGSPDAVGFPAGKPLEMLDYKVKKRGTDYKVLMNEAAYIRAWEVITGQPINIIRIVTFHPITARAHEQVYENDPQYFADFLTCMDMYRVNKRAEAWFEKHCKFPLKG